MSIKLMSAAWELDIPSAEKMVLLCLADYAGDHGAACWPSIETIARKCSKSVRAVQYAIKALEEAGWLLIEGRKNDSNIYHLAASKILGGANSAPVQKLQVGVQNTTVRGANSAPKPPMNHQEPPSSSARGSRLPPDFVPMLTERAKSHWQALRDPEGELQQFKDYHTAKGSIMKDWQAAFRTWLGNSVKYQKGKNSGKRSGWLAAA